MNFAFRTLWAKSRWISWNIKRFKTAYDAALAIYCAWRQKPAFKAIVAGLDQKGFCINICETAIYDILSIFRLQMQDYYSLMCLYFKSFSFFRAAYLCEIKKKESSIQVAVKIAFRQHVGNRSLWSRPFCEHSNLYTWASENAEHPPLERLLRV